ncbi:FUSC family protein [Helicobacter sp. faydin-H20]|uniref:FUSC family protein n=1 Tax=Helicobacter anatolicus TaxID=2905874 RepID=UPI001E3A4051|nr:FUSC family protein [Helicobacter anatolicus]MCE3036657.1 FUSC family protein [Helicobacter anatolicus]
MAFLTKIKRDFLHFISLYDAGYISFVYSLKALFASVLSAVIVCIIFDFDLVIWAASIPIHLYFLNVVLVEQKQTIWYFVGFILLTALIVFLFCTILPYAFYFALLLMCVGFIAGIIGSYQMDLQRVVNMSLIDGLIACIYIKSGADVTLFELIVAVFISGVIGIFTHFFMSLKKYGKVTRKYFPDLLLNLALMANNLHRNSDFIKIRYRILNQMEFIKKILNSKAANMKDSHTIKNTKRALFYLYRIEEIYQCLNAIHNDTKIKEKKFIPIRKEIVANIRELKKIFDGSLAHLKHRAIDKMDSEDFGHSLVNIVKIIYNKMHSFRRGGEEKDYFVEARNKKTLKVVFQAIKNRDHFFYYGVKYAFVLGIAILIADVFNMSHGAWIAMACVAIMRPNLGGVKHVGKEYILGVLAGLVGGLLLVFLTQGSLFFYFFFVLVVFGFIYFRAFPYGLWASFMMMAFIMMFSLVYGNSYLLILDRFIDIALAFLIVFFAFLIFWPKYSTDEIFPNIQEGLVYFDSFYAKILENFDSLGGLHQKINLKQKEFLSIYNTLETNIIEAKKEKNHMQKDMQLLRNSLRYLEFLNQNTLKLYYLLVERWQENLKQEKELYMNDLQLLKTRYEMMNRAMQDNTFYFKEQQDGRFMVNEVVFKEIVMQIFNAQNGLFKILESIKKDR